MQVDILAFALAVWGVRTSDTYTFVDLDSAPFERFENVLFGSRHETLRVGVFDAENEVTASLSCEQVVVECRAYTAYMERSGGTGRETYPYFAHGFILLF